MENSLLVLLNVEKYFGGLCAIQDLSFEVERGRVKAIIGPNGAGKTTLFNVITGILRPDRGSIKFKGREIKGLRPYEIARLGISRTFQNIEIFKNMTVLENVMVGRHVKTKAGFLRVVCRSTGMRKEEKGILEDSMEGLNFVGLKNKGNQPASELSLGDQRLLEIARALATNPDIVFLDEPASGLNDAETETVSNLILKIRDQKKTTVLLVEHVMKLVMRISEEILVLNFGSKIAEGPPEKIRNNPEVIAAYLGDSQR